MPLGSISMAPAGHARAQAPQAVHEAASMLGFAACPTASRNRMAPTLQCSLHTRHSMR